MKGLRVGILACALGLLTGAAGAQSSSPYDMTYKLRSGQETPLFADMTEKAARKGSLPGNASGIILRWCRDEIPFGTWQFGSRATQLKLLDERWCEVSFKGAIGNVPGRVLAPE